MHLTVLEIHLFQAEVTLSDASQRSQLNLQILRPSRKRREKKPYQIQVTLKDRTTTWGSKVEQIFTFQNKQGHCSDKKNEKRVPRPKKRFIDWLVNS